jgi:hypothetical protein
VDYWLKRIEWVDKEGAQMTLKWVPNSLKWSPKTLKQGPCYRSFDLNGSHFQRNTFQAKVLPLWALGVVIKPCLFKELRLNMGAIVTSILHKSQSGLQLRRAEFSGENRLCITNYNNARFWSRKP